eukprot:6575378-Prymnesium_polylepis.1
MIAPASCVLTSPVSLSRLTSLPPTTPTLEWTRNVSRSARSALRWTKASLLRKRRYVPLARRAASEMARVKPTETA